MKRPIRLAFGERVRNLRVGLGWSQEQLAERAGLHRTYVGGIERGERNPSLEIVSNVAVALGVTLSELFVFDAPKK